MGERGLQTASPHTRITVVSDKGNLKTVLEPRGTPDSPDRKVSTDLRSPAVGSIMVTRLKQAGSGLRSVTLQRRKQACCQCGTKTDPTTTKTYPTRTEFKILQVPFRNGHDQATHAQERTGPARTGGKTHTPRRREPVQAQRVEQPLHGKGRHPAGTGMPIERKRQASVKQRGSDRGGFVGMRHRFDPAICHTDPS
jgi:hypothetical protein